MSEIDSLRDKLRELGYLDAGVDRFVLAPARADLGTWGLAWRASLRIGLLASVLAGVPAAVAVGSRLPTLVAGPWDAVVLALYIGGMAGLATAGATLLVTVGAARLARLAKGTPGFTRRARRLSRVAGLVVAAASLGYLTLWWRAVAATASSPAFVATALALLVAALVALLLGHTTTLVALAVLARSSAEDDHGLRSRTSWGTRALLTLVTILASTALFALAPHRAGEPSAPAPPLVVVPTGVRLLVVGIDGLDPRHAVELARSQGLDTLGTLLDGAHVTMPREPGRDPVAVWMSIATAQPPERHGALGVEARRIAGVSGRMPGDARGLGALLAASTDLLRLTRPVVSSATERRERTFWEVAAAAGLRTVAVNWWTTWPALPGDGVVLTERTSLRLDRGGPLQGEMTPLSVYETLRPRWADLSTTAARAAGAVAEGLSGPSAEIVTRAASIDATQVALLRLLDPAGADLVTLYLPGLDIAQAALFADGTAQAVSAVAERVAALERLYRQLDTLLASLREWAPRHVVVLVTHPGRVQDDVPAMLAITGLGTASGRSLARSEPRLEDAGATILHLLGLPLSHQLSGQVRTEILPSDLVARRQPRYVERYDPRDAPAGSGDSGPGTLDEEARERLRSLGYVR